MPAQVKDEKSGGNAEKPGLEFPAPARPKGLRAQLLALYLAAAVAMAAFAYFSTEVPTTLHLMVVSSLCVLIGCKHSVWLFCEPNEGDADMDSEEVGQGEGVLKMSDALWFPVMGSCTLYGLYVVYKYVDMDAVKFLITCYILFMCTGGFSTNVTDILELVLRKSGKILFKIPFFDVDVTFMGILSYIAGCGLCYSYIQNLDSYEDSWVINNIFGISFCVLGIRLIGINSYKTGAIMLIGLFFYDVFWVFGSTPVFGSNVMVTVAKGVQAPIKLLFPRLMESMVENSTEVHFGSASIPAPASAGTEEAATIDDLRGCKLACLNATACVSMVWNNLSSVCSLYSAEASDSLALGENATFFVKDNVFMPSMLGLGDIVVPGIFLALLAKWDVARPGGAESYGVYFPFTFVFYFLSLLTTVAVMWIWEAAQPALLYIVPYVLLSSAGLAVWRGEFQQLWSFIAAEDEEEESDDGKKDEKDKKE